MGDESSEEDELDSEGSEDMLESAEFWDEEALEDSLESAEFWAEVVLDEEAVPSLEEAPWEEVSWLELASEDWEELDSEEAELDSEAEDSLEAMLWAEVVLDEEVGVAE